MSRNTYRSDLTDEEWSHLQPLIPPAKPGGRPRDSDMREILNAALYVLRHGGGWRRLPRDFPPWQTVYSYVRTWRKDGTWAVLLAGLRQVVHCGDEPDITMRTAIGGSRQAQTTRYPFGGGSPSATTGQEGRATRTVWAGSHDGTHAESYGIFQTP